MLAGCCRLFTKEVNTIYLHVPNGDNLAAHFLRWTYIKAHLVLGSLCWNMLPSQTQKHIHSHAHRKQHTRIHTWECGSGEWNLVLLCNYKITHRLQWGKKALNAWKNMKLPLFQWSRKNSSEKCQQPIAAGFCCRGRHGLWFPHVSFLSHYASSFHPIKHKYGLRSTTQGASWCSFFWEKQTEEGERQRVETDGWRQSDGLMWLCVCMSALWLHFKDGPFGTPHLRICQFMSLCISERAGGRQTFCFCFVLIQWHGQTAVQFIRNDDWWCLLYCGKAWTWNAAGPPCRNLSWTCAVLALVALVTFR